MSAAEPRRSASGRERGAARAEGRAGRTAAAPRDRARTADAARTAAFDVLRQVGDSDAYANLVLPPLLASRRLTGRDAAFATELAYGTLRLRGRYDAVVALVSSRPPAQLDPPVLDALRLGVHQLLAMRVPAHAAVSETVALTRAKVGAGPAQLVNAVLRRVAEHDVDHWLAAVAEAAGGDEADRLAATESHPAWIVRALRQALVADGREPDQLEALLDADNTPAAVTLVARPGLVERDALVAAVPGAVPGRWAPTAVVLAAGGDPAGVPAVADGRAGVQDEGSQLVTLALSAVDVPGTGPERWLDLCAGPGGKAALLGALAARRGAHLVANELQPHRAELVRRSVRALAGVEVRTGDGRDVGPQEPGSFQRVLVDAPCTGLGALRRRPESRWRRTPSDLGVLSGLQRELLMSALAAAAPGGVVAYVTCSPHVAETRLVVADVVRRGEAELLDATDALRGVAPGLDLGPGPHAQLWPHLHGTDAMHLSLLRRL